MPTVAEIEGAAARLRRENRRVSVCNVRSLLPRGGSYSDIGPPLARWKAKADYRAKGLPKEVPAPLAPAIEAFAAELWAKARDEAEKVVERRLRERDLLEREFEREAAAAWAEVDRLMEEVGTLRARLLEAGGRDAEAPLAGAPGRPGPRRPAGPTLPMPKPKWPRLIEEDLPPRKFWDGVLREVPAVIAASGKGRLTAAQMLDALPEELRLKADAFQVINPVRMRKKLRDRVLAGKYVREVGDDLFEPMERD